MSNRFLRDTRSHHDSSSTPKREAEKPPGSAMPLFRSAVYHHEAMPALKSLDDKRGSNLKRISSQQSKEVTQPLNIPASIPLIVGPGWSLECMKIKKLPFFHPLEDYHRAFEPVKLDKVTIRLRELFQITSVCVKYFDGNETKSARAACTTLDNAEFVVVFWSKNGQYIAEVQRTKGDSMLFYQHAQRVLDAVDGDEKLLELAPNDPLDVDMEEAESEQECIDTVFARCFPDPEGLGIPSVEADFKNAIELACNMLGMEDRHDCWRVGLESLKSMTDVHVSGHRIAKRTAAIVLDDSTNITEKVSSFAASVATSENDLYRDLGFSALTILGQSVNLVDAETLRIFARLQPNVVQALLMGAVHSNAHIAYLSTHTLAVMHANVKDIAKLPVKHMQLVGATTHAALANASERLLQCINN